MELGQCLEDRPDLNLIKEPVPGAVEPLLSDVVKHQDAGQGVLLPPGGVQHLGQGREVRTLDRMVQVTLHITKHLPVHLYFFVAQSRSRLHVTLNCRSFYKYLQLGPLLNVVVGQQGDVKLDGEGGGDGADMRTIKHMDIGNRVH